LDFFFLIGRIAAIEISSTGSAPIDEEQPPPEA
jgi:hypothetical protein